MHYFRGHSKLMSLGKGGGEYAKLVTKSDIGVRGVHANSDITTKKIMYKFLLFVCFWSAQQQLSFGYHFGRAAVSTISLSPSTQSK